MQGGESGRSRGVTRVQGEVREQLVGMGAPAVGRWGAKRPLKAWAGVGPSATAAGRRPRPPRWRGFGQHVDGGRGDGRAARQDAEQQRAGARRGAVRGASPEEASSIASSAKSAFGF